MTGARARCLQVMVPEVPLAINLAYKCWSMERRRYRSAHDVKDTRYVAHAALSDTALYVLTA